MPEDGFTGRVPGEGPEVRKAFRRYCERSRRQNFDDYNEALDIIDNQQKTMNHLVDVLEKSLARAWDAPELKKEVN